MSKSREEMIEELVEWQAEENAAAALMRPIPKFIETEPEKYIKVVLSMENSNELQLPYEHWKGGSFIRIHRAGCVHSESQRVIDPDCEHAMLPDGRFATLSEAETEAAKKVNRWKKCSKCC